MHADHPVSLQLKSCLGHCWADAHQLSVPPVRGEHQKEQVVEFMKALKSHIKQPLLVVLDGLRAHRSKLVREYLDGLNGHIQLAFLPPYAPDLNPVEYLWAWLKRHALANYCPANLGELHTNARNKLKSAQKHPSIIAACWM